MLLPGKTTNPESPAPFYSEVLEIILATFASDRSPLTTCTPWRKALTDFISKKWTRW